MRGVTFNLDGFLMILKFTAGLNSKKYFLLVHI